MNGMPHPVCTFSNRNIPCFQCGGIRFLWIGGKEFLCVVCGSSYEMAETLSLKLMPKGYPAGVPAHTMDPLPELHFGWAN